MNLLDYLPHFIILFILYILTRIIIRIWFRLKIKLPYRLKIKADKKFKKLLKKFEERNKRKPNKKELFRIIINASHITIRKSGKRAHFGRQKIRKYLLEKHKVVKKYIIR